MTQVKKAIRLSKIAREFNIGISRIVTFLNKKGFEIDSNPNTKVLSELYDILVQEYGSEISLKRESERLSLRNLKDNKESISINDLEKEQAVDRIEVEDEVLIKDISGTAKTSESLSYTSQRIDKADEGDVDVIIEEKKDADSVDQKTSLQEEIKEAETKIKEDILEEEKKGIDKEKTGERDAPPKEETGKKKEKDVDVKVVGKIDLSLINQKTRPAKKTKKQKEEERKEKAKSKRKKTLTKPWTEAVEEVKYKAIEEIVYKSKVEKLSGPVVVGKIDLSEKEPSEKLVASSREKEKLTKKKRRRIRKDKEHIILDDDKKKTLDKGKIDFIKEKAQKKKPVRQEVNEEDVQQQIKDTLARLTSKGKSKGAKYRREKREAINLKRKEEVEKQEQKKNILKITEFISVNELASMMNVPANEVIQTCMNLGLFVSINQRLDAETMALVADEFNFKVEFISVEVQEAIKEEKDDEADLVSRPPIVTVMGHVDHGKTSLLDYIRHTNVIAGEAGGITQHIGAYNVALKDNKKITFLDTPGHEAFTAMRARGAKVTDIAVIVVAADDSVMPQTVEAINHANAAGVPIVFAINKIDKDGANPEKIKEELANMNFLVEDWGGKYQSQEISAKKGQNIDELLEKVLLEAEMLDLKANPNKRAVGTIIESSLDKGRGYVATVLIETGTLRVGNVILAGTNTGHVKAMYNERGIKTNEAKPSTPILILGLNGAPQAGDNIHVMESDREAKEIASKRGQLQREQGLRTQKHITLEEIGRRITIGSFQELNVIVKGDVDGSVEALADSLIKLSTEEIQVNIIHKAVGQISESDILLAAASNAIVIGFQVRPSINARKLAEKEEIDIRLYSVIYDAINELKDAMEGLLSPEIKEEIVSSLEVREIFKITKVGTIAGCLVKEGKITRNIKVRVIREGIVIYAGELGSLKRFKDDAKEVVSGYECGLNVTNFNDIKVGDIIEGYKEIEVKKKL